MSRSSALRSLVLLSLLPSTVLCLTCYKCVYSNIDPLYCSPMVTKCAAGERCLYSKSIGTKGSARQELKEKRCATASECGVRTEKRIAGLVFRYTTRCCSTDLCNAAAPSSSPCWTRVALILGGTALAVLLASP